MTAGLSIELRNTARCLKRLAAKIHRLAPRYRHDPAAQERLRSHACGVEEAAVVVRERAVRLERAECAAHKKPRKRYHVTRCKRCNALIEKEFTS